MAANADAYRTLGLAPGASIAEVKRAYRRLVKANHPDAAGEAALPRFLAIQAAYDRIVDPDGTAAGGPGSARPAGSPSRPWQADADRAGATHRAYGGRTRRARSTRTGSSSTGSTAGSSTRERGAGTGSGSAQETPRSERPPRPPKKATLGSTSYDGAEAEPFEPDWGGASWYGTTSGTYWTLNPKEYADPRKHGPEYQARARRAAEAAAAGAAGSGTTASAPIGATASEAPGAAGPSHTTASWWAATDAGAPGPSSAAEAPPAGHTAATATDDGPDPLVAATWLDAGAGTVGGRVGRAVIGWAPLALGLGWSVGELTGCGRFSASCDPSVTPLLLLAQLAVLAVLLLVPRLAAVALVGTVGTLVAAIPGALVLASMGGASDTSSSRGALAVILGVGWLAGIGVGLVRELRRTRAADRPVS